MKRKTNLFYISGPDSKFITFSNYTESLTGNFLSTDTKLYPSRFMCINMSGLTNSNKSQLIQYLAAYYENKLAVLRDDCCDDNVNAENLILPLNYLLETLMQVVYNDDNLININTITLDEYLEIRGIEKTEISDIYETCSVLWDEAYDKICAISKINKKVNKSTCDIVYISEITEQDYNGTYTDTICNIDLTKYKTGIINTESSFDYIHSKTVKRSYDANTGVECLYRWDAGVPSEWINIPAIFDINNKDNGTYIYESPITDIALVSGTGNEISFNMIIPLFDVTNINYKTNSTIIEEMQYIDLKNSLSNILYTKNVPLGIWFADEQIVLKKDSDTGFAPSWSLLIGAQFKPFPYSNKINSSYSVSSNADAYATFSQVLARQNEVLDKFNDLNYNISSITERLNNIETQLKHIGTSYTIDSLHKEMMIYEKELNNNMDMFKDQVMSYIINLKWKAMG